MKWIPIGIALFGVFVVPASAQQVVTTLPSPRVTTQGAATVAVTNTFVQAIGANTSRTGCTVQYKGAATGYVFFGANPTVSAAFSLTPGQSVSCVTGGMVLTDAVNVTGTAADVFAVAYQ